MLGYLRKQSEDLKNKNMTLVADLTSVKDEYAHLREQHSSLTASYEALKQHATQLSQTNMKMRIQGTDSKKEFIEAKKALSTANFAHKSNIEKLKDLMRAKDEDHEQEIARMKAELEQMRNIYYSGYDHSQPPQSHSRASSGKTRAHFNQNTPPQSSFYNNRIAENNNEDDFGNSDTYFSRYGTKNFKGAGSSGYRKGFRKWVPKESKKVPQAVTGSSLGKRATDVQVFPAVEQKRLPRSSPTSSSKASSLASSSLGAASQVKKPTGPSIIRSRSPSVTPHMSRENSKSNLSSSLSSALSTGGSQLQTASKSTFVNKSSTKQGASKPLPKSSLAAKAKPSN